MSHHRLSECGLYRETIYQMLYGSPTPQAEQKRFKDSVLEKKSRKVNDLVARFEKNLKLNDTTVEVREEDKETVKPDSKETVSSPMAQSKARQELSMDTFIQGILRTSSPIPDSDDKTPVVNTQELVETPILPYRPIKLGVNFDVLDTEVEQVAIKVAEPSPLQPQSDATKTFRSCLKSESKMKVAEAKNSSTPRLRVHFKADSPDSAYCSPGLFHTSVASSSSGSTPPAQTQTATTTQNQEEQTDRYLKLSRELLHDMIKKYATWKPETLRPISVTAASIRLSALQKISSPCVMTQLMQQMYERCIAGQVTEEMDTIVVAIFHLLDDQVHVKRLSVPEEYIVRKYCKMAMQ
ncbi:hypothetical protein CAEBREN_02446 [Caenorhabditis brenneri]|uniref:Uncharacterized protein n=1 Tax=Caenorhabditis brenneri TaxID=135651 RepID=G0PL47_CAEBE|nr:hypothetical protein CAEBREN_02446 [Caenorhabditis brenneri]